VHHPLPGRTARHHQVREAAARVDIINLEAAHDCLRPILAQERVRESDRGFVAEDGKRTSYATHVE
jgi:hypothetical protein